MSGGVRRFPPDVARALQQHAGEATFTYTPPAGLTTRRQGRLSLLETPYQEVLATLSLDARGVLHFTRTGSRREGVRVARCDVMSVLDATRWVVSLSWDDERISVDVRREGLATDR